MQTNFVIDLGNKSHVPVLSFSATSPPLTSLRSPYFFWATENDCSQVGAITSFIQAFGWKEVVPIYMDNAFELYKLMTMQTRVFIVHMYPSLGSRLFTKAKQVGIMNEGYVWIITTGLTNLLSSLEPSVIDSMQGVLGENLCLVDAELNIFGLLAYDAIIALAMAVEKTDNTNFGFDMANVSTNSTDLEAFGVSRNGLKLLQSLLGTRFSGLTGDYTFVDRQLQSLAFQIVNVNGDGVRGIGFWTPEKGLIKKLNSTSTNSTSKSHLGPIIWPRGHYICSKGDPSTNKTTSTGYCINVFNVVMQALPYAINYEFIPFTLPNGTSAALGLFDLPFCNYEQKFDAMVGDTTIVANRSQFVDFTLPYTKARVSMIVPIKDNNKKNTWVFLKPLTWGLWMTSACFFLFIGFVIWVLEHRINEDFRGPLEHQVGISFWFSFSIMVFSHRERVISNLGQFVVIVWCFVVLILTQRYTASVTSLLTVQRLQPTVNDVTELIKREENVGFLQGSFVVES
ncbi:hypothetical protein Pint_12577 [Pistacia integerrima]|uniref:Uncharacterized protein n=1 Tax=Pistacia integerrima TaxID=434235 RepID=A0ACC0Y616_9ROSI|nr:hypothetical protein Pint_12577 [Pistacia integerrima]